MKRNESSWRKMFVTDISQKIRYADKEYDRYKKTAYIIYLQQASNKLFSAVENYLILKYDNRVRSYQQLFIMVQDNNDDAYLLSQAVQLHYFYYNGELQMSRTEAAILYVNIKRRLRDRLRTMRKVK
jgi:hypothetical protein